VRNRGNLGERVSLVKTPSGLRARDFQAIAAVDSAQNPERISPDDQRASSFAESRELISAISSSQTDPSTE